MVAASAVKRARHGPGIRRERRPGRGAVAASGEGDTTAAAAAPTIQPSAGPRRGPGGRRDEADAVVVLDELAEAEIGVLRPGRDAPARPARRFAAAADDELDLGREEQDERQPERDPRAEVVAEEPGDDEHERGRARGGLEGLPVGDRHIPDRVRAAVVGRRRPPA